MTQISSIDPAFNERKSVYNALKIQVNSPQTNIPEGLKNSDDDAEYNAVSIEVNDPSVNVEKPIYSYPEASEIVTYDKAGFMPVNMPEYTIQPLTYQTNMINNKTFLNAEYEIKSKKNGEPIGRIETFESTERIEIPKPNYTTVENEKDLSNNSDISFNGISFKDAPNVEVAKDAGIKSAVNINEVVEKLKSNNFDEQALQLEEIAMKTIDKPTEAIPYLVTPIFSELENIIKLDDSNMEKPTEEQLEIRKKIILNEIAKAQQKKENPNIKPEEIKVPYEISKSEFDLAVKLSPFEMAERNKEYGIYTLAGLLTVYIDEFEKNMGDKIPLTDLPAVAAIVDSLKSDNPDLQIAGINALLMIKRPEYNDEIKTIISVMTKDKNPLIAEYSSKALDALDNN